MQLDQLAELFSTTTTQIQRIIDELDSSDESLLEQVFALIDDGVDESVAIAHVKASQTQSENAQSLPLLNDERIAQQLAERRAAQILLDSDRLVMSFLSGGRSFGREAIEVIDVQSQTLSGQLDEHLGNDWDSMKQRAAQAQLPASSRLRLSAG